MLHQNLKNTDGIMIKNKEHKIQQLSIIDVILRIVSHWMHGKEFGLLVEIEDRRWSAGLPNAACRQMN
jgi:hypothetical protein